jgi:ankyrin repeat protein
MSLKSLPDFMGHQRLFGKIFRGIAIVVTRWVMMILLIVYSCSNSKDLVECGFDGDLEGILSWIEKGYHIESVDGRKHTALSEASCNGHIDVVNFLIQQGADPNAVNDTGRSPLVRMTLYFVDFHTPQHHFTLALFDILYPIVASCLQRTSRDYGRPFGSWG